MGGAYGYEEKRRRLHSEDGLNFQAHLGEQGAVALAPWKVAACARRVQWVVTPSECRCSTMCHEPIRGIEGGGLVRILVTNDDGIESSGIHELVRALAATSHDVVVVAPDRDWSGSGAAIGELDVDRPIPTRRVEIPGAPGVEAWSLAGPPATTVVAGVLGGFGTPPDLVVSGINAGLNTGRSVLHSGTVGAALTAQNFGISGLAVSVAAGDRWHWSTAAVLAVGVLDLIVSAPPRSVLNLNVPARPRSEVRGIRWTRLAAYGAVRARVRSVGDAGLEMELDPTGYVPPEDTDQGAVDRGFASLTTVVGIAEAWPQFEERSDMEVSAHFAPGADLAPVHEVPDASDHRLLRARLHDRAKASTG